MALLKHSDWPLTANRGWLGDLFDGDRYLDSDWLRNKTLPAVNVHETDKNYEIEVAIPGHSKKDFVINAENGVLTISSEKEEQKEQKEKDYTRREFSYGSFSRSFTLPENANEDGIQATYQDGILRLQLAKKEIHQTKGKKSIEVK